MPLSEQYPPPVQKQEGSDDAMIPLSMNKDNSFEHGMTVMARWTIDFGDVVIEQGTQGQIISKSGEPILVRWDRIGDRHAVASQLVHLPSIPIEDEDVYLPKKKRTEEVQVPEKKNKKKEVVAEPQLSIARMEDNKAKEALRNKGKGPGKGKGKAKDDVTV